MPYEFVDQNAQIQSLPEKFEKQLPQLPEGGLLQTFMGPLGWSGRGFGTAPKGTTFENEPTAPSVMRAVGDVAGTRGVTKLPNAVKSVKNIFKSGEQAVGEFAESKMDMPKTVGGRLGQREATGAVYKGLEKSQERVPLESIRNHLANAHAGADEAGQKILEAELNKLSGMGGAADSIPMGEALRVEQQIQQVSKTALKRGMNYDAAALREARHGILGEMGKINPEVAAANATYFRQQVAPKVLRVLRTKNAGIGMANLIDKDPAITRAFKLTPESADEWITAAKNLEKYQGAAKGQAIIDFLKHLGIYWTGYATARLVESNLRGPHVTSGY